MSLVLLGILNSQAAGAGGAGAYDLLETQVLASSASSVTFTGLDTLASGYQHLQIRIVARANRAATNDEMKVQFNSDTGTNYASHYLNGTGSAVESFADTSVDGIRLKFTGNSPNPSGAYSATILDILDFSNASKNTTTRALLGEPSMSTIRLASGLYNNTNAVTTINFGVRFGSGYLADSRFSLYGIKGA